MTTFKLVLETSDPDVLFMAIGAISHSSEGSAIPEMTKTTLEYGGKTYSANNKNMEGSAEFAALLTKIRPTR